MEGISCDARFACGASALHPFSRTHREGGSGPHAFVFLPVPPSAVVPRPNSTAVRPVATLVELFHARCAEGGAALAVSWVADDLSIADRLSFQALHRQSSALAERLAAHGRPGDRVLLALRPGLDFVRAFWACLLAGRVAVPVPALDAARLQRGLPRLQGIAQDAAAGLGLCDASALPAPGALVASETLEEFHLFPSPVRNGQATVHLKLGAPADKARIQIFDLAGKKSGR